MWNFKGTVTLINEDFLYFKLKGNINVHMVLLFICGKFDKLPKVDSEIEIELPHQHFTSTSTYFQTIILCSDCRINGNFTNAPSIESVHYRKVVEINKFTPDDLLTIDNHLKMIEENLRMENVTFVELIVGILSVLSRRKMLNCRLKTVNQLKFIENYRELYKKFSYWTFGVHKINEPLIAYLEFDSNYCRLYLSNLTIRIPVTVINCRNIDCINRIVVIWKCRIITEIYNCEKFATIQYCLVDRKDIDVVDLEAVTKPIVDHNRFVHNFKFVILSKSSPMVVEDQSIKFWLFVRITNDNSDKILLHLDSCYSENFQNLQIGGVYTIYHKRKLKKVYYQNIHSLYPRYSQYSLEKDNGFIDCTQITECSTETITKDQALLQIASKNLISFSGRITMKKFVDPLWSRTKQYKSDDHMGTPGNKTHLLEFVCDNKQRLTVYLNNFENLSRPYGLIPNMSIIVRNVIGHNGKYYKSTPFTIFEIVDYRPDIDFDTACLNNSEDWGRLCYLGLKLPIGVIVTAIIFNVFLLGLSIKNQCLDCVSIVKKSEYCHVCKSSRIALCTSVTLLSSDCFAKSKIIAKDNTALELIKLLLGNYKEIYDIMRNIGEYKYQVKRNLRSTTDNRLDQLCDNYNYNKNIDLQVKCRKLEDLQNGEALYFLLQSRSFYKL